MGSFFFLNGENRSLNELEIPFKYAYDGYPSSYFMKFEDLHGYTYRNLIARRLYAIETGDRLGFWGGVMDANRGSLLGFVLPFNTMYAYRKCLNKYKSDVVAFFENMSSNKKELTLEQKFAATLYDREHNGEKCGSWLYTVGLVVGHLFWLAWSLGLCFLYLCLYFGLFRGL